MYAGSLSTTPRDCSVPLPAGFTVVGLHQGLYHILFPNPWAWHIGPLPSYLKPVFEERMTWQRGIAVLDPQNLLCDVPFPGVFVSFPNKYLDNRFVPNSNEFKKEKRL